MRATRFASVLTGSIALLVALAASRAAAQESPLSEEEFQRRLEALAQLAPPPGPGVRGEASIAGRVLDEEGRPVEGVVVRATRRGPYASRPWNPPAGEAAPPADPLGATLVRSWTSWTAWRAKELEAKSDPDGRFRFEALAAGDYSLQAWRRGFSIVFEDDRRTPWHNVRAGGGAEVRLVALPVVRQRFEVLAPDGSVATEAELRFERVGNRELTHDAAWTRDAAEYSLAAGDWYAFATQSLPGSRERFSGSERPRPYRSDRVVVSLAPDRATPTVTLALRPVAMIAGRIEPAGGGSIRSPTVLALPLDAGQEADASLFASAARTPPRGSSGTAKRHLETARIGRYSSDGAEYQLVGLAPGRWLVGLFDRHDDPPVAMAAVELADLPVIRDFEQPARVAAPSERSLTLHVRAPDGSPLRDVRVAAMSRLRKDDPRSSSPWWGERNARPLRVGDFEVSLAAADGDWIVSAEHPSYGARSVAVTGDLREAAIAFASPVDARLRLLDYDTRAAGRKVTLEWARSSSWTGDDLPIRGRRFESDPSSSEPSISRDGGIDLGPLQPGRYVARIEATWLSDASHVRRLGEFEFEAGRGDEVAWKLPFPRIEELRVQRRGAKRSRLTLESAGVAPASPAFLRESATVDDDGIATFREIPAGDYLLRADDGAVMRARVPADGVVAFAPGRLDALRVVLSDPGGGFAQAGLATGDAVVAIDGREFSTPQEVAAIRASLRTDETTLTVVRGERRFEVVVATKQLADAKAAGGALVDEVR